MKYFPFLRGKQNELLALKGLADRITKSKKIVPILEPVNWNATTKNAISAFVDFGMKFILICNPVKGDFLANQNGLKEIIAKQGLMEVTGWIPALGVHTATKSAEVKQFRKEYDAFRVAFVYYGRPRQNSALKQIQEANVVHHVFMGNRVDKGYIQGIPANERVIIEDRFQRRARNAEYPDIELFTDRNTAGGNPKNINFGDFSIVGDHFSESGGPAHAVALHHIHFETSSYNLLVTHFKSDRRKAAIDTPGKTLEALNHLVKELIRRQPNNTAACNEYRELCATKRSRGLGYMKRLAIQHHLEVILDPNGLEGPARA